MADFTHTREAFSLFAQNVVEEAQRNIGTSARKFGIRAKWPGGRLSSFRKRPFRGRIEASGNLRNSLKYAINDYTVVFTMAHYGQWVDQGRKPGKGMPVKELQKWIRIKPIKPRDLKTNKWIKATPAAINTLSYLINRKIKTFGIAPTYFFSDAFDKYFSQLERGIDGAIELDLDSTLP